MVLWLSQDEDRVVRFKGDHVWKRLLSQSFFVVKLLYIFYISNLTIYQRLQWADSYALWAMDFGYKWLTHKHTKNVLSLLLRVARCYSDNHCRLTAGGLLVLSVWRCSPCVYLGFLWVLQIGVPFIWETKLIVSVNGYLSLYVGPVIRWRPVHFLQNVSWDWLQLPMWPSRDS